MRASRQAPSPAGGPAPPPAARGPNRTRRRYARLGVAAVVLVGGYVLGRYLWAQYHVGAAERALEQRDFRGAEGHLDRGLAAWPGAHARLLAARAARRAGRYDEAAARLTACRREGPTDPALDREERLLRTERGDFGAIDRALAECLARGDAADPLELEAALVGGTKVALAAFTQRETTAGGRAIPFVTRVLGAADLWLRLRTGPADHVQGLVWRGIARGCLNDRAASLADLRDALARDPAHPDARLHLALTLAPDDPLEAAEHLRTLLREPHPEAAMIRLTLARIDRNAGRTDDARRLLDEVLAAQPDSVAALLERGSLAADEGQLGPAEQWLTRAQARAPDDPKTNFALAAVLRTAGRPAEAQPFTDRYLRLQEERRKRTEPAPAPAPR